MNHEITILCSNLNFFISSLHWREFAEILTNWPFYKTYFKNNPCQKLIQKSTVTLASILMALRYNISASTVLALIRDGVGADTRRHEIVPWSAELCSGYNGCAGQVNDKGALACWYWVSSLDSTSFYCFSFKISHVLLLYFKFRQTIWELIL